MTTTFGAHTPADGALLWTAMGVSLVVAIGGVLQPERLLLFSDPRGKGRIVELKRIRDAARADADELALRR